MLFGACLALAFAPGLSVSKLRTEYLTAPIGIGETAPRFFWALASNERSQQQTAYRVIVASSPSILESGRGDLWDSGKVRSGESIQIEYKGKPLKSRDRAWWTVQVWDKNERRTVATPTTFEIGLLNKSDWKANWVGLPDAEASKISPAGAKWLWYPEGEPEKDAPEGYRWFKRTFDVNEPVTEASLVFSVDDSATVLLNGEMLGTGSGWNAYVPVPKFDAKKLKRGRNELVFKAYNEHSRAGLLIVGKVQMSKGAPISLNSDALWMTSTDEKTWVKARELVPVGGQPYGTPRPPDSASPSPYIRKSFVTPKKVAKARVYSTARGLYELYVDGQKVSRDLFRPGWTDYKKRIQYQAYDVTNYLDAGAKNHAIGMVLGDGWYCGNVAWTGRRNYGPKPMGLAQLEIEYTDGTRETIASDSSWKVSEGPIRSNDLLMGENYDARMDLGDWSTGNAKKGAWRTPDVEAIGNVPIVWQPNESVQVLETIKAKKITEPKKGTYVVDLGQNMVGWVQLRVKGPAGTMVTLRHAEMLNPDGTIYTTNLRRAKATDTYTLNGKGLEWWQPRFTFHGFRYVEVTGYPGKPNLGDISGIVVGSDTPKVGTFETSNRMLNQLQHNIFWGQRGNYLEAPTDCPQRDERLGWMGDAQIFVKTATFNNDIAAFMTKWTQDVEDGQNADGSFADVSPRIGVGNDGAPAWGDAGVIVPWTIYEVYKDKRLLARRYDSMKKWVDFIDKNNPNHVWTKRSGANYGDWLNVQDDTPRDVVATAYFAHSTELVAKAALALGKKADAMKYSDLATAISKTFREKFMGADGFVRGNSQTAYILALNYGWSPAERAAKSDPDEQKMKKMLGERLVELIKARKDHLSTGFLGCGLINPALSKVGQDDLAFKLLMNDDYPGWLYSVKNGATTIWERWDGWTDTKGFQDPGMNSFNHYSFGAVGEWMVPYLGGIEGAEPGSTRVAIRPNPHKQVKSAKQRYESLNGTFDISWKIDGDYINVDATLPPGTSALVELPVASVLEIQETGKALSKVEGVSSIDKKGTFIISSGTYHFRGKLSAGMIASLK